MNKLNPWQVGGAMALTLAIINVICAILVSLFPDLIVSFVNAWTHGIDLTVLQTSKSMTLGSVILGVINVAVTGFLVGSLYAACYNLFRPK
ncbi:MFS transporter [Novimethylophilus kurashikiensis]|uniref:MFS transporter n=1 Tax=Novimethylophilus kurashikiensis TaxID=1825523 RepID=A0A2R5F973_9PROT|nr:DUF5676 family membrane protein [Novimethylophilus kurashikiensis]GBG14776.1 MFS transporter [Novimethylophilus kurashikiensis]